MQIKTKKIFRVQKFGFLALILFSFIQIENVLATPFKIKSRIQALEAEDVILHQRIDTIQQTPGPEGPQGPAGINGTNGIDGAPGAAGTDGVDGSQGEPGIMGPQGQAGINGTNGADGVLGAQGPQGVPGIAGPQGDQGPKGDDGATGPAGSGNVVIFNSAPTVNDDVNREYAVGSIWVDTNEGGAYILIDDSPAAAEWKLITSAPAVYAIGDTGPAGGLVFLVDANGQHGLEAAPEDQGSAPWGCYGTEIGGADELDIGAGAQNTVDILAGCLESDIAAELASNYVLGGYDDWYLPSKDELNAMYVNLHLNGVGGFASSLYWSSSEASANVAWSQYFSYGTQTGDPKYDTLRVRAVRAF
ncbi:MAG: DUF1566 domain-containing protein [Gammaproteobacteria bacterium]|nr:DUF1566 domain-containing protein [Gammaproteobacteria bacterium]